MIGMLPLSLLVAAATLLPAQTRLHGPVIAGHRTGAFLGVSIRDVSARIAERESLAVREGAYVQDVERRSPAARAGIERGDVIVRFGAVEIADAESLVDAVGDAEPGDSVEVVVHRRGSRRTLSAVLGGGVAPGLFGRLPGFPSPPAPLPDPVIGSRHRTGVRFGMEMLEIGPQLTRFFGASGRRAVLVASVTEGSPADSAGFRAGDIVTEFGGESVRDVRDVLDAIRDAGDERVPVVVLRSGKQVTLNLEIGGRLEEGRWHLFDSGDALRDALRDYHDGRREDRRSGREEVESLLERLRETARRLRLHCETVLAGAAA